MNHYLIPDNLRLVVIHYLRHRPHIEVDDMVTALKALPPASPPAPAGAGNAASLPVQPATGEQP